MLRITSTTDCGSRTLATKKLLVAFDPAEPDSQSSDFLVPQWSEDQKPFFLGLKSGKVMEYGMVVFAGREVSPNDLFAMLVDSGRSVPSVEKVLAELESYLDMIKLCRVGAVLALRPSSDYPGFRLEEADVRPSSSRRSLP